MGGFGRALADILDRIELASFHLVEKLRVLENTIHTLVILGLGSLQDHDNPKKDVNEYVLIFHKKSLKSLLDQIYFDNSPYTNLDMKVIRNNPRRLGPHNAFQDPQSMKTTCAPISI
jgi:hypothetical protein